MGLEKRLRARLESIAEQGLLRTLRPVRPLAGSRIRHRDRIYLNLAGNDYLNLAGSEDLIREFYEQADEANLPDRFAAGATASRLMTGNHPINQELEDRLRAMYAPADVLVFNSGYHANIGILPALAGKGDLILADKLCHASLIDGMRLTRARVIRYPHLDYGRLAELLRKKREQYDQVFLVTESIFSMDGDEADLNRLADLRDRHRAVLYVDEAHAVGMRGAAGLGLAEEQSARERIDLLVGTFGKAWAGQGAFVACSPLTREYLINTARSLIFTTGLPPVSLAWLLFVAARITAMEEERAHVRDLARFLRQGLRGQGLETAGTSHIVPVLIGGAGQTMRVAERLRQAGYWPGAVRPPTVPAGTARLRLSLTAAMNRDDLAPLPELIRRAMRGA
jgi:8-amino-7-oxononanoate synthase